MKKKYRLLLFLFSLTFISNFYGQTSKNNHIKVVLSDNLIKSGHRLIDFSIKTTYDQFGFIVTYFGFSVNKPIAGFIISAFDKEGYFLFQTDSYDQSNTSQKNKNIAFLYHTYIKNIDLSFIKKIEIE